MDIENITVEETCGGCPHTFHFYNGETEIGGIRYRWGHFQCWPVVNDELLDNIIDADGPEDRGIISYDVVDAVLEFCTYCLVDWHNGISIPEDAEERITELLNR